MAVVYFTSNASTGAGSLSEAIQNAQPGDVVRPDETVFERGATIEIALASTLTIDKNLTLDASPFRVALNGGSVVRCAFVASGATVAFSGFDFLGGATSSSGGGIYVEASASLVLTRCRVAGCSAGSGGGGIYSRGGVALNDCIVTGCVAQTANGGGISATGALVLDGSTVVGNSTGASGADVRATATLAASNSILGDVSTGSATAPDYLGCVVGVASSEIGFVAPPPDDLSVENWDANAWQNWDLRLLDDASPNPSPYRDAGDVDNMSRYDVQGNFRGRETGGAASCSPGAYETLQADLFWIGVEIDPTAPSDLKVADYDAEAKTLILSWTPNLADATGYDVQYSTSGTGWANLTDAPADATSRLCGGLGAARTYIYRIRAYNAVGATAWSTIAFTPSALDEATAETGTREVVSPSLLASNGWAASRFARRPGDAAPQLGQTLFVDGVVSFSGVLSTTSTQTFGLTLGGGAVVAFEPIQIVYCSTFTLGAGSTFGGLRGRLIGPRQRLRFGANARIDTTTLRISINDVWCDAGGYVAACECYAFAPPEPRYGALTILRATSATARLSGAYNCESFKTGRSSDGASYSLPTAPGTSIRCRSFEYKLDFAEGRLFTNAVVVELYGDATATVSRTGTTTLDVAADFAVDATDATSATLTLDGQAVYGDASNAAVELTGSAKIDERGLDVASLTVADGAAVDFSGVDAVLSATESATVGAAAFSGVGYFATPPETDLTAATFAGTIRVVDYFAGVETFAATATGPTTATLAWSATDATARVCVERENAVAPNGWEVVATTPTEDASPLEVALSGKERFRIFDGATFTVDSAWFPTGDFYVYVADDISAVATVAVEWETATQLISAGNVMYRNENVLLLASVKNKLTAVYLSRDEVEAATATVYAVSPGFGAREIWSPVDGWADVAVPLDAILETPTEIDGWTLDAVGPNFVWTPDATTRPLFGDSGTFAVQVCVKRKSSGNPIYFTFRAVVK